MYHNDRRRLAQSKFPFPSSLVPGPRDDPFPTLSPHSKEGVEGWETDSGEFYLRNRCMSTASSEFLEKGIKVILLQSLGPTEVSPPS
jgi:hypothetical protein